jgi:hypothetical protein
VAGKSTAEDTIDFGLSPPSSEERVGYMGIFETETIYISSVRWYRMVLLSTAVLQLDLLLTMVPAQSPSIPVPPSPHCHFS